MIVAAAITVPLGLTTSKEYAELEWPIDILIRLVWLACAVVFFGTLVKHNTSSIYVASLFSGTFVLAVAMLHVINNVGGYD